MMSEKKLSNINDVVEAVIGCHLGVVEDFKEGITEAFQYLVGQCIRTTHGLISPKEIMFALIQTIRGITNCPEWGNIMLTEYVRDDGCRYLQCSQCEHSYGEETAEWFKAMEKEYSIHSPSEIFI